MAAKGQQSEIKQRLKRRLELAKTDKKRCPTCGYVGQCPQINIHSKGKHRQASIEGLRYCKHCEKIFFENNGDACEFCGSKEDVKNICLKCYTD